MKLKKNIVLTSLLVSFCFIFCSTSNEPIPEIKPETPESKAKDIMENLWKTSSLDFSSNRQNAFDSIQHYADLCPNTYFNTYLKSLDASAENIEKYNPVLGCYRLSFEKVIDEVKSTKVKKGTTAIWMLYNMGYIVKTSTGCFGIDINHRYAEKLEPYLDFLCITHNHSDHYSKKLIEKMFENNKPVISNYLKKGEGYQYTTTATSVFNIGSFNVTTNITDHNNSLKNFVTTFQIDCGDNSGNLVLMHSGDSNYEPDHYNIVKPIDIFIARYSPNALLENRVIGSKVTPKYVFLSHILELAHADVEKSRWPIDMGLERASKINCDQTILPFWGEKIIWENKTLN